MSLERVVLAPFQQAGTRSMTEQAFVVHLSLQRDWFSPDQAKRVVDLGINEGLLGREDEELVAGIDPGSVAIPSDFVPDEGVLSPRSTFEQMLGRFEDAGRDRQHVVAEINRCQNEFDVTIEAAAVLYAAQEGIDLGETVATARDALLEPADGS